MKPQPTFPESCIYEVDGRALDFPAAETYRSLTLAQIDALCQLDTGGYHKMPPWEDQHPSLRLFHRLKAYWTVRGARDPGFVACFHLGLTSRPMSNAKWEAFCREVGRCKREPRNLRELEEFADLSVKPNALLIMQRCPQMAMIHALRGNVGEPYWWAALAITEHATPNLSRAVSDGYPRFSEAELAQRVARIHEEKLKPALCSRFAEDNPRVCHVCRFQGVVRSPIALGYEHEPRHCKGA